MMMVVNPTFLEERALLAAGFTIIAGTDEVGCGSWAGPVCAGAVVLPLDSRIGLIRDSKALSPDQRSKVAARIHEEATAWAVGWASHEEVDALNVRVASALAMRRAIEALAVAPHFVLSDAFQIPGLSMPVKAIIRGDASVKSIAAASIMAKVARDTEMARLDAEHPGYGFADHKGYGTKAHRSALARLGPSPIHRLSFQPLKSYPSFQKRLDP